MYAQKYWPETHIFLFKNMQNFFMRLCEHDTLLIDCILDQWKKKNTKK